MAEYPRTMLEFRDWFADDAACRDYLAKLRWPEGFRCPICSEPDHWVTARGLGDAQELMNRGASAARCSGFPVVCGECIVTG
ncbi:MAG TPA: transposase [Pseudolabrys sp.]